MATIEKFSKQAYEEFTISADFSPNMEDGEVVVFQTVSAINAAGDDVSAEILDQATVDNDGAQQVQVLVRAGEETAGISPYKITFYCETDNVPEHKWELDVKMIVKEL